MEDAISVVRRDPRDKEIIEALRSSLQQVMEFWMGSMQNEMPAAMFDGAWAALAKARPDQLAGSSRPRVARREDPMKQRLLDMLVEMVNDQDTMREPYRNEDVCARARKLLAEIGVPGFPLPEGGTANG